MRALPIIRGVDDVAARNLCTGCGTCAYLQPADVRMVDVLEEGRRPAVTAGADTSEALRGCPGVALEHPSELGPDIVPELVDGWGPVLEVWEGHAADPEIRFRGSSGGAATALALHGITHGALHGVLHTAAREDAPLLNRTVLSRTRADLIERTGSRYAPASPCDGLDAIAAADAPCALIGKPCDIAGAAKARRLRPSLDRNLALTIAIFCAGTPSTAGTVEMVRRMGIDDPRDVTAVRYRGNGWPGVAEVRAVVDGQEVVRTMSYGESWGEVLQTHCQWRCRVCADHTGEFADVAVGDPWHIPPTADEPGRSLLVARTERGRRAIADAVRDGALVAVRVSPQRLPDAQPNLLRTRGAVWGRVAASRAVGVAAPRYRRMGTFATWRTALSWEERARSVLGTLRRIATRRLHARRPPVR